MIKQNLLTSSSFGLYVILTDPVVGYEEAARQAVAEGVYYLQLRMKNSSPTEILAEAVKIREITRHSQTRFIMNDSLEIAMEVDADGIHLGQEDMPLEEARRIWNTPGKIYGLSTHNPDQAARAIELRPDYIGVGPVYPTPTKAIPDPVVGPVAMGNIIRNCPLPAVAIGGITPENLPEVLKQGAINFSAVRAITQSPEPGSAINSLMKIWSSGVG